MNATTTMYTRTTQDEQSLIAAGYEEMDAHWFVNESGRVIQMPGSPYASPLKQDSYWDVWQELDGDSEFVASYMSLDMALQS